MKHPPRPAARRFRNWLAGALVVLTLAWLLAPWLADRALVVRDGDGPGDVIIVLGGETKTRAPVCARLFTSGRAPVVLISGADEWEQLRAALTDAGLPAAALRLETNSTSTLENARECAPLLREWNARTVLLVTSRYHARRAVATFSAVAPAVKFVPVSAPHVWETYNAPWSSRHRTAWREWLKTGWYWVRHGISPFSPGRPAP